MLAGCHCLVKKYESGKGSDRNSEHDAEAAQKQARVIYARCALIQESAALRRTAQADNLRIVSTVHGCQQKYDLLLLNGEVIIYARVSIFGRCHIDELTVSYFVSKLNVLFRIDDDFLLT